MIRIVSKLPREYMAGLEIVSDEHEAGVALYQYLVGRRAGEGGEEFVNVTHDGFQLLTHELGHAIEQRVRLEMDSMLLQRWEQITEQEKSVSGYGDTNPWEDFAEFSVLYAYCSKLNKQEGFDHMDYKQKLYSQSPQRFVLFEDCLCKVNTILKYNRCDEFEISNTIPPSSFEHETGVLPSCIDIDDPSKWSSNSNSSSFVNEEESPTSPPSSTAVNSGSGEAEDEDEDTLSFLRMAFCAILLFFIIIYIFVAAT